MRESLSKKDDVFPPYLSLGLGIGKGRPGKPVNCTIIEGNPEHTVDDKAVAYEGHKTSCGAELMATIGNFGTD